MREGLTATACAHGRHRHNCVVVSQSSLASLTAQGAVHGKTHTVCSMAIALAMPPQGKRRVWSAQLPTPLYIHGVDDPNPPLCFDAKTCHDYVGLK
mmetsp:Transcript_16637/g.42558  ORF Transcript_16637/g.42558 Transcript_16637/m.42558 type:complete len:96 (-) Transcript_16637:23-310(-)